MASMGTLDGCNSKNTGTISIKLGNLNVHMEVLIQ